MDQTEYDELLGITRCVRCGHRLEGEIECPFCSMFPDKQSREGIPKWIFLTACFLTSPFSLYGIIRTKKLNRLEKILAFSGAFMWFVLFGVWYWG